MVDSSQIRAGRALVGWSQSKLAERAQVTQVTIANIETQRNRGSHSSLSRIQEALESRGVEFIGNGVRHRESYLGHFEGEDAYIRLLDDVYFTLKDSKGQVLFKGADERKNFPGVEDSVRRLTRAGISMKLIIEKGNDYILGDLKNYRQISPKYFSNGVTVVYGNKFAILVTSDEGPRVHIVQDTLLAEAQKKIFDFLWDYGEQPERSVVDAKY